MNLWLVALILVAVLLAIGGGAIALRRRTSPSAPPAAPIDREDEASRHAQQEALAEKGTELLERRVELDSRRGGGYALIDDAFQDLQDRLKRGEITEEEFEAQKVRLLGG